MGFGDAIKSGFSGYVKFGGRSSRSEYWYWVLFILLVQLVLGVIESAVLPITSRGILVGIFGLIVLLPNIAVSVRRLHDIDKSGWWLLIGLIPILGVIVLIVFFCLKGTDGDNRFGPDPLASRPAQPAGVVA
ncbi:DUF805 domain-containing protein [Inquilinus sp. CAU 1745]|uniref:DUF805 domain-containing protein n=1 Tax=Inquilinus sp. CAU 1745 TaxID=3140369 RepID=UPI00325C1018